MNKFQLVVIVFLTGFISLGFAQERSIFIKAGQLYDSENNLLLQNKGILISENRIKSVTDLNNVPENARIIDLSNYTVLPGLIDAHTHVLFSQDAKEDFAEHSITSLTMESDALRALRGSKRARSYLDVGITSIKDLGNSGKYLDIALRDAINEGTVEGPRIYTSGQILAATGGQLYGVSHEHQDIIDLEYRIIKDSDDAINAVREHVNQNVDLIKICADNIPNNTRLSIDEMKTIVETAHSYGLTVTAHAISNQSAWDAIQAGVDGIEHGFVLADSTLKLMAQKGVFLVPTENSRNYMLRYNRLAGYDEDDIKWIDNYINNMNERLQKAIDFGVPIVVGSDNYTNIGYTRGKSSQDMFRTCFEAGMKPLNVLQSATYLSALFMKKENKIGVIKPNAMADIIAVEGDIKNDFVNTIENVVFVMKGGHIYIQKTD